MKFIRTTLYFFSLFILFSCSTENTPVYQLTASVNPTDAGSVSPAEGQYDEGSQVTLTATANENWAFDHWQGDASGSDNPHTFSMTGNKDITAFFVKQSYPLTISVEGEGTVQENVLQEKSTDYPHGTLVELTAQPAEGWRFAGWSGAIESTENPIQLTVEEATEIIATFERKDYTLTITTEGQGAVTEEVVQSKSTDYPHGTIVRLTAEGNTGWEFTGWSGDLSGEENPVEITFTEETEITAMFEKISYPLTVTIEGQGQVEEQLVQTKSTNYKYETLVELTAVPDEDWVFSGWSGDISSEENPVTVQVNEATNVTATFHRVYTFSTTVKPVGRGSITPESGEYDQDSTLQVQAVPASEGWRFKGWTGDLSGKQNPAPLTMNDDKSVTAYFEREFFDIEILTEGEGAIDVIIISGKKEGDKYEYEAVLELTAEPAEGWDFLRWELDKESENNPVQIDVDQDKTIRAVFGEKNTFYLAENGVTVKCPNAAIGEKGFIDEIEYEAVDRTLLEQRIDESVDLLRVCTSLVTDMSKLFNFKKFFNQPIKNWDVSSVTDMEGMFSGAENFNQSIALWNVSNVTDMQYMFIWAESFNQPIGDWDVSNVTNIRQMFYFAKSFNQSIGSWNVSKVTNMEAMFLRAENFNQPINDWDISNVTTMHSMFSEAKSFNQPISNWNVDNVTDMRFMFSKASSFNQSIGNWNVGKVTNMGHMFRDASLFNQDLTPWCVSNIPSEPDQFSEGSPLEEQNKPIWGTCPD